MKEFINNIDLENPLVMFIVMSLIGIIIIGITILTLEVINIIQ